MNGLIKVLLADDHPMFLEGVRNALQKFERIQIVAECTDGNAVEHYISKNPVDVAVLDINMPGQDGLTLARTIHKHYPHTRVVFLSMHHPAAIGSQTIFSSVTQGYVLKNSGSQILSEAIIAVSEGRSYLDPKLKDLIQESFTNAFSSSFKLSSREKEIIRLIMEGKGNKEIARELYLSELTIKTHRKNIYQKLDVNNVAGLMQTVRKLGIELHD